jgi:hypothetical protein
LCGQNVTSFRKRGGSLPVVVIVSRELYCTLIDLNERGFEAERYPGRELFSSITGEQRL